MIKDRRAGKAPSEELSEHIRDIRQTFNLLRSLADSLHADLGITASLRAVIEFIALEGPSTVPQIAEQRSVSRQGVQKLADTLLENGLLIRKPNPGHRRSDLLALSVTGKARFRTIRSREKKILRELCSSLPGRDLKTARNFMVRLKTELIKRTYSEKGD